MSPFQNVRKIGVVLSSGFFGFFSHAGFLKALEHHGIQIGSIGGASSGALAAGLYMSGHGPDEILEIFRKLRKKDFWDVDAGNIFKNLITLKGFGGMLKGLRGKAFFEPYFTERFEDCHIPGIIIALNLNQKKKEVISTGSLTDAVFASSAVPYLFKPVRIGTELYLDGGIADKAPVLELYKHFKPDLILVHLVESHSLQKQTVSEYNPLEISTLCNAVVRKEDYLIQKEYVESQGCRIVEFNLNPPSVAPTKLERGQEAFDYTYRASLSEIKKVLSQH